MRIVKGVASENGKNSTLSFPEHWVSLNKRHKTWVCGLWALSGSMAKNIICDNGVLKI